MLTWDIWNLNILNHEDWFWSKNRMEFINGFVTDIHSRDKEVQLEDFSRIQYDKLRIATGPKSNKFIWPMQNLDGVQGLYSKQDLDLLELDAPNKGIYKRELIVGGGLIGTEFAEMLRSRDTPVTFLVCKKNFRDGVLPNGESKTINLNILEHHINIRLETNLVEILSNYNGRATAV